MLLKIKEKITGWVAYLVVGLITIPFALWGINFYFQDGGDFVVLEIGDQKTMLSQFNRLFLNNKKQAEDNLQNNQEVDDELIKRRTLISLMRAHLVTHELDKHRYSVPDIVLAKYIAENPRFHVDGVFNRDLYLQFLQATQYTQSSFEKTLRNELRSEQFNSAIRDSGFVTEYERRQFETFLYQERDADYIIFPIEGFINPDRDSISEERSRKHYDDNTETYKTPLRGRFSYVEYTVDNFYDKVEVDSNEVMDYYQENFEEIVGPEKRTVAHILLDPERHGENKAQDLANEVYQKLEQGEDFASLANTHSDDSLTAASGGRLDALSRNDIEDEAIKDAVFSLQVGDFSKPIKSDFGIQIFQLLETDSASDSKFEEYEEISEKRLKQERAHDLYDSQFEDFKFTAYEDSLTLDSIAEQFELKIQESDWVTENQEEGLFSNPRIAQVAFSDVVINLENNSETIEYEDGKSIVVRLIEKQDARQQTYEEVKDSIWDKFLLLDAGKKATADIQSLLTELSGGVELTSIANQHDLKVQTTGFIRRSGSIINPGVVQSVFRAKDFSDSTDKTHNSDKLPNGDYVLVQVKSIRQGDPDTDAPQLSMFNKELNIFIQGLLQDASIYVNEEGLKSEVDTL